MCIFLLALYPRVCLFRAGPVPLCIYLKPNNGPRRGRIKGAREWPIKRAREASNIRPREWPNKGLLEGHDKCPKEESHGLVRRVMGKYIRG